jgi:hypothetical protein
MATAMSVPMPGAIAVPVTMMTARTVVVMVVVNDVPRAVVVVPAVVVVAVAIARRVTRMPAAIVIGCDVDARGCTDRGAQHRALLTAHVVADHCSDDTAQGAAERGIAAVAREAG